MVPTRDEYSPNDVAEAVVQQVAPGRWRVRLVDSMDDELDTFVLAVDGGFRPNVLNELGPILNKNHGVAYLGDDAWDDHDGSTATMYTYGWPTSETAGETEVSPGRRAAGHELKRCDVRAQPGP